MTPPKETDLRGLIDRARSITFQNFDTDIVEDLTDALDALLADRVEVRKEALRWACAEMCQWCGIGIEVKQLEEEIMIYNRLYRGPWVHLDGETGKYLQCYANPIRELMEKTADQGQGEKEGVGE